MIRDLRLALEIMKSINLDNMEDYVDPWRLYQNCELFARTIDHCIDTLEGLTFDIVAAVSELGLPLAVSISQGFRAKLNRNLPVAILNVRHDVLYVHPDIPVQGKGVLLCDDLLAGGTTMHDQVLKLKALGALTRSAIVLLDNKEFPKRDTVTEIQSSLDAGLVVLTDTSLYRQVHK